MLRLSKKADYALMAMKHLVLQRLARQGLLDSTQGTHGGYTLGRPAVAISVADVIEAIDGPFTVTACSTEDTGGCDQFEKCSIRDPLWQIRERIVETLGTVTMAEMAEDRAGGTSSGVHPAVMRRGAPAAGAGRSLASQAGEHER